MPAPNDLNSQIAFKKGWTWSETIHVLPIPGAIGLVVTDGGSFLGKGATRWCNPQGKPAMRPNFTGTLHGMAEMMRELGSEWGWGWWHGIFVCFEKNHQTQDESRELRSFFSSEDRPGDCVGEAYMSIKEPDDANTNC